MPVPMEGVEQWASTPFVADDGRYTFGMAATTIKVSKETRDRLRARCGDAALEDAVVEALDLADEYDFWRRATEWGAWRDGLDRAERDALAERDAAAGAVVDALR